MAANEVLPGVELFTMLRGRPLLAAICLPADLTNVQTPILRNNLCPRRAEAFATTDHPPSYPSPCASQGTHLHQLAGNGELTRH